MASFQNVYSELVLIFFFAFFYFLFIYLLYLFLYLFLFLRFMNQKGIKEDRKLGNLSIFGSTSFILQGQM